MTQHVRQDVLLADQNLMSAEWFVAGQAKNYPGVAFPANLYWPSRWSHADILVLGGVSRSLILL